MKIAVWHNLPSGGGKRALYYHVKGLLERGHTIESWCPSTADQTYLPLSNLIQENVRPLHWHSIKRSRLTNKFLSGYYWKVDRIQEMDEHCKQCAAEINQGGFDVLLANSCIFFHMNPMARYVEIPKAIYLGEPFRPLYEARPQLPWVALPPSVNAWWSPGHLRTFWANLVEVQGLRVQAREEIQSAKAFDLILVNSLFSRESVLRAYGLDTRVCYLGIDTELFKPTGIARKKIVVGLSTLR